MRFDDRARIPFAFLGVLLLLTSSLSLAYISGYQSHAMRERIIGDIVQKGNEISALVHSEVEAEAYWIGTRAVHHGKGNLSRIVSAYDRMMGSFLGEAFPRKVKGFLLETSNHSSSIVLENRDLNDFEERATVENDNFNNQTFEELETARSGYWMELQRTMTFSVAGRVTYLVSKEGIVARNTHEFSEDLDSLYPFLDGKMETLVSDSESEFGDVARMLRYMLSTLAQVRVLQGWGGLGQDMPGTDEIISARDIERALNVALILEDAGLLRLTDADAVDAFDLHNPGLAKDGGLASLLQSWLTEGSIDPSDLYFLYNSQGNAEISIAGMISQAIYAIIDQTTLKYIDYFGLAHTADFSLRALQLLANSIQDFLDWISGTDREAWLARSWFKDIANEMKTSTWISQPVLFPIPDSNFQIQSEEYGLVNFTIPGFDAQIPFEVVDMGENFDDFWRGCFRLVYGEDLKTVHESQRDLVKEIATRIGEFAEEAGAFPDVTLEGVTPTDNVSILQNLSEAIRRKASSFLNQMRSNQSFVDDLVPNLWSKQANLTANVVSRIVGDMHKLLGNEGIEKANQTILQHLLSKVENGTGYEHLTEEERNQLTEIIGESVKERVLGIEAHELLLKQTTARLEGMRDKAISAETPSGEGGIYSKLKNLIISSSGILADAAETVGKLTDSIVESEDVENIRFLVSTTRKPFQFWDGGTSSGRGISSRNFTVEGSRNPLYLSGRVWKNESAAESLQAGDLWVALKNPLDFPGGSGNNVHYTDITRLSSAPYISTWRLRVKGLTELSVIANRAPGGLIGHEDRITIGIPLDFEITITAKSGWPLEDVVYDSSNTFLGDIWDVMSRFLESVWNSLIKVYDWILDGISKILSLVSKLIGTLLSYAQDVLKAIEEAVEITVELLQSSIAGIAGLGGNIIENIISMFGTTTFEISAFGGNLRISLNGGNGTIVKGELEMGGLKAVLLLNKLADMNLTKEQRERSSFDYDAIVSLDISLGHLGFQGTFDPALVLKGSFFQAEVEWGDEWRIDFEVPYIEKYFEKRFAVQIPSIPTPIGTVDLELGFLLKLREHLKDFNLLEILSRSFEQAWSVTLGETISIDSAARFVVLGISNAIAGVGEAIESNIDKVIEVVLYLEGQIRIGGTAGVGMRLAFILGKAVLSESFLWISNRLNSLISSFGAPPTTDVESDLARVVASETFIGFEFLFSLGAPRIIHMMGGSQSEMEVLLVISVRVSVATIGLLLGMDLGLSRIDFGVCLEGVPPGLIGETARNGEVTDIWLLHGTAVQL